MQEYDRTDLTNDICARYGEQIFAAGTSHEAVQLTLKAISAVLPDALAQHGRVEIHDLGVFHLTKRAPRKGRNFHTGETVEIPAHDEITFNAAPFISEIVEQTTGVPTN
jgi:nucleoid DNA-binding protein